GWALGLCMALMPMYVFDTIIIDNDAAMNLFAVALIWLTARAWLRDLSPPLAFSIGIVSGLMLLTKPTGVPIVVVAGIVILANLLPRFRVSWQQIQHTLRTAGVYAVG